MQTEKADKRQLKQVKQSRPGKRAEEEGAFGRYREPIGTAVVRCVVLPWITPSEGRQAAVQTEGGLNDKSNHSWDGSKVGCMCRVIRL